MNNTHGIKEVANLIIKEFNSYLLEFISITRRAKIRFEQRDWKTGRKDALERLILYEKFLSQISIQIKNILGNSVKDKSTWIHIKQVFSKLISDQPNADIAETFFNSVTRKLLNTVGIDREVEFFYFVPKTKNNKNGLHIYNKYKGVENTRNIIRRVIKAHKFRADYDNLERDIEFVAREVDLFLWPIVKNEKSYSFEILKSCFYRNKVAYIVGRIVITSKIIPIIIPLYNEKSGIYIDSVLLEGTDASSIFCFAYSHFQVETEIPGALVNFLSSILPKHPISELYNSIGFYKYGKTEFYRDLHRLIHVSKEQFVIAPGEEGSVMIVFTLQNYNHVFKVIKDKPCFIRSDNITDKSHNKSQVKYRYKFVCRRDRVGRLVDTQEFENLRFKTKRFSEQLIREFKIAAKESIFIKDGYVIINHLYQQRKVTPLPIYLTEEDNPNSIRKVVIDFGYLIKDLAAAGLFPADLFNTWNYGVTEERGRVVLYDFDDVIPFERAHFKLKPTPRDEYEEMQAEEDWIIADKNDFFIDEIDTFVGIPYPLRGIFDSVHKDLFTIDFWQNIKSKVRKGEIIDIIPYDRNKRFRRLTREA